MATATDKNPFAVRTPENLSAEDVAHLFVDVFADFPKILDPGHTIILGPRGTGKSMMLRFLEPTVSLATNKIANVSELPFFAVHVPLKRDQWGLPEASLVGGSPYYAVHEHRLLMYVSTYLFRLLDAACGASIDKSLRRTFLRSCAELYLAVGGPDTENISGRMKQWDSFADAGNFFAKEVVLVANYLRRLPMAKGNFLPYEGALASFSDFLIPMIDEVKRKVLNSSMPIFVMLDDVDNLPMETQKIVNSWIATRSTNTICVKIGTQPPYKTWRTVDGRLIESPHDYSEIDISTIYTSNFEGYLKHLANITNKRLVLHNIDATAESFFPADAAQERGIDEVREELRKSWNEGAGRGARARDDVNRYAIPEFMRRLGGTRKASSTFSYSGFKTLADISSGIVRWFLEPAAFMYRESAGSRGNGDTVRQIPPHIQDRVIREWSRNFILNEFEKQKLDASQISTSSDSQDTAALEGRVSQLHQLIQSLGKLFRAKLIDEKASERRAFSILVTRPLPADLESVFSLGVEWGYLQRSTIGAKSGLGRATQYILSRRLAPIFNLDPSGYTAYLSVTPDALRTALVDSDRFVVERLGASDASDEESQLELPVN